MRMVELARHAGLRSVERQHIALHDVSLGLRNLAKGRGGYAKRLRQRLAVVAAHPVAEAERAVLGIEPVIERQNGMAGGCAKRLNRVAVALRKIPEVARAEIDHLGDAVGI